MASKSYSFLAGALCLLASTGFAQRTSPSGSGYDVADSSVIPSKRMPQQSEFMAGTYNFPAKPRSMWEIGIKAGNFALNSDIPAELPTLGFGAHIRKALGYIFSLRLEYTYGTAKGLNWNGTSNYYNNPAWWNTGYRPTGGPNAQPVIFENYKTNVQDLALEGIFTLNNIRFHKSTVGFTLYTFVGAGATTYDTKVNALDANGLPYQFNTITGFNTYKNRKNVIDQLKAMMDDTYETPAETEAGTRRPQLGGRSLIPVGHVGVGVAFRVNKHFNIALEDRFTFTQSDLLDGHRWAEQVSGSPVLTGNFDAYNYASLGLNFNVGAKAVEPLWWLNPLDYAYQEIRKPRLMILPKPTLPDSDGDGVTDQFDQEVTPAGCPVDTHGVSLDTDGDGVPDCRDKEKITPTYCQPVDADGIGKCPCPDSTCIPPPCVNCPPPSLCSLEKGTLLSSIQFSKKDLKGGTMILTRSQKRTLDEIALKLQNNPECKITLVGCDKLILGHPEWRNPAVIAIANYLQSQKGIDITGYAGCDQNKPHKDCSDNNVPLGRVYWERNYLSGPGREECLKVNIKAGFSIE